MSYPQPKLPTSAELIRKHSTARVLTPSHKRFATGHNPITGLPEFSRQMTGADAVKAQARKFR